MLLTLDLTLVFSNEKVLLLLVQFVKINYRRNKLLNKDIKILIISKILLVNKCS